MTAILPVALAEIVGDNKYTVTVRTCCVKCRDGVYKERNGRMVCDECGHKQVLEA